MCRAAAVLAASPGTAYAQSVGFVGTSSTMMESASPDAKTPAPITIDINVSGLTAPSDGEGGNLKIGLGELTFMHDADDAYPGQDARADANRRIWLDSKSSAIDEEELNVREKFTRHPDADKAHLYGVGDEARIPYDNNGVIKLVIIDPGGDDNWQDNKFTIDLRTDAPGVSPSPGSHTVTVVDTDSAPTVAFSRTSVALTEETQTATNNPVTITVDNEDGPAGFASLMNRIKFTTSPAGAVVTTGCVPAPDDDDILNITINTVDFAADGDTWTSNKEPRNIGAVTIGIEACGDMSRFNDDMVTFSFDAESLKGMPAGYGNVAAGADLVVTVRSEGEDTPTVTFSAARRTLDEGGTDTVAIVASGNLATEVGSVMVSVSGNAVLSLLQGADILEAGDDGMYTVDLDGSANTILTIMADDGMTATATITIESANGADIGARNSLAVTVSGVTQETDPEPDPEDPVVTLSADSMEIEAGGTTTIIATANRSVTADDGAVKIDLTVEGDGTLDAESITIAMGEMSGSVMLTANESVTVEATGSGISDPLQVMVTVAEAPPDEGPEPVPALPLIAQWLLGLGLLGGGARQLFRRRRQG